MTATECVNPQQVEDNDYMTYLDGAARLTFVQHLQNCACCQAEIAAYADVETALHQKLGLAQAAYRANCPPTQLIGEYSLGMGDYQARQEFKAHLKTCQYCSQEYQQLNVWAAAQTVPAKAATNNPTKADQPRPENVKQWLGRVVATVLSVTQPLPGFATAGLRGAEQAYPVTYEADGVLINFSVLPADPGLRDLQISGQLSGYAENTIPTVSGAEVRVVQGRRVLATEKVDEIGYFFFAKVKPIDFDLEFQLPDRIVLIPNAHQAEKKP